MRQRQQKIVEYVLNVGIAGISELAEMFNVSPFTIRRDIDYLAQSRLIAKVKGGAQRIETPSQFSEASLPHRMGINVSQKEKIAAKALEFIRPGDTIFLDGSSTIACFARAIAKACRDITVVTNSVLVALELSEAAEIRLLGLGGVFDRETFSYVGAEGDTPLSSFFVDKAFFSCTGFVVEEGTFENAAFNKATKRLIAEHAAEVYLLIDSSKFGRRALSQVLKTSQIAVIIADRLDCQTTQEKLKKSPTRLVLADNNNTAH